MPNDEITATPEASQNPLSRLSFKDGLFVYSPPERAGDNQFWATFAPGVVGGLNERRELVAQMALMIQSPRIETFVRPSPEEMAKESFEASKEVLKGFPLEKSEGTPRGLLARIFPEPEVDLEKVYQAFDEALAQEEPYIGISSASLEEASRQKLQSALKMLHGPEPDPRMIIVGRILLQTMHHYYEALRE
jgi:hypothetical protein